MNRTRFYAGIVCVAASCGIWGTTVSVPAAAKARASASRIGADPEYVSALGAVNRFLQAWQNRDEEAGLVLLTDAAKKRTSTDSLDGFFSVRQGAYEIRGGKRLRKHRYSFSIVLFDSPESGRPRMHYAEMVVLKSGKDDWAIDNLPSQ